MTDRQALKIIQEAYLMLRSIPREEWMVRDFTDGVGKCCYVGHYTRLHSDNPKNYDGVNCNRDSITHRVVDAFSLAGIPNIMVVNDHLSGRFAQDHPKDRTMAASEYAMEKLCEKIKNSK